MVKSKLTKMGQLKHREARVIMQVQEVLRKDRKYKEEKNLVKMLATIMKNLRL